MAMKFSNTSFFVIFSIIFIPTLILSNSIKVNACHPLNPFCKGDILKIPPRPDPKTSPVETSRDIDFKELKNGVGPVVFLINGFGGCDPCIMGTLHNKLKWNQITFYDLDWNDIYRRSQARDPNLSDANFLKQMDSVFSSIPDSRPIILIGHSFGGDSALKVASRTSRKISLLGVIDGVQRGGIRTNVSVSDNVAYFYNRWTENPSKIPLLPLPGIPLNPSSSGEVSCSANYSICDQKEQSCGYNADGSELRDSCGSLEITCPGYEPWPGGSNGTKHRKRKHGGSDAIYRDDYIQEQLFQKIIQIRDTAVQAEKPATDSSAQMITSSYQEILGRKPNQDEINYWNQRIAKTGETYEQILEIHRKWKNSGGK